MNDNGAGQQTRLIASAKSHPGMVRPANEDRHARFDSPFGEVFLVADGMGGARGGALAAQMVADEFQRQLASLPAAAGQVEALKTAAGQVASKVHSAGAAGNPEVAGMGSTVVLALISAGSLIVSHIGDSRAYLYRDGQLSLLTRDHTVVQQMVDAGMISEEAARNHPDSSVLSRAIGPTPQVEIEISAPVDLKPGDGVLLCSDGLSGYVDDSVIEETLKAFEAAPEEAVAALIQRALQEGGQDNVTVQYICAVRSQSSNREPAGIPARAGEHPGAAGSLMRRAVMAIAAIILISVIVYGVSRWSRGHAPAGAGKSQRNGTEAGDGAPKSK